MGGPFGDKARLIGGRYRLLAKLGQGGMGTVWQAHDELLDRTVAVKEVDLSQFVAVERGQMRERTLREARTAARLSHPNAVSVFDVVEDQGEPWIVMSLVVGDSLADQVAERGPLPPARVAEIGLALLSALQAAHQAGILHRDVKPSNVLIGANGSVVLTDFGIATLEGDVSLTSTGLLVGSPAYMAPERARGQHPGPTSDLWSLGATLYAAVEGISPYERGTPVATLTALAVDDLPPPRRAGPLAPALMALLERDPRRRVDADGAGRLLQQALAGRSEADSPGMPSRAMPTVVAQVPAAQPPEAPTILTHDLRSSPAPRRGKVVIAAVLAILGLIVVGIVMGVTLLAGGPTDPGKQAAAQGSASAVSSPSGPATPSTPATSTPPATPSAQAPVATGPALRQGDRGEHVRAAQYLLRYRGRPVAVDGVFSPAMSNEVRSYQVDNGLPGDALVGQSTWSKLVTPVERGNRGDAVRGLQTILNEQGESLFVDGVFGASTDAAVRRFQAGQGLFVDGVVGPKTWTALFFTGVSR